MRRRTGHTSPQAYNSRGRNSATEDVMGMGTVAAATLICVSVLGVVTLLTSAE